MHPRLLVVDDEESILFAMREYFTTMGYEVDCARELEEAQALLATKPYSLVIADLRLTGSHHIEGLDIVALVKHQYPSIRIVVLTAHGSLEIEREARQRGADAFLHKPRPLADVAQVIRQLLEVTA